jgi:hypothetical protein
MRDLHELTIGQRIVLTVVIVIVILLLLAAFGYLTGRWDEAGAQTAAMHVEPPPSKWDARMLALDREALDEAYKDRLVHVFAVWMRDDTGQPGRAINGARQARHAYIEVMRAIEMREQRQ